LFEFLAEACRWNCSKPDFVDAEVLFWFFDKERGLDFTWLLDYHMSMNKLEETLFVIGFFTVLGVFLMAVHWIFKIPL